jgi:hypothetical protein
VFFPILTTHCDPNFHSLRCYNKTSLNFFFLFSQFHNSRLIFTIDLSNLNIWYFSFLITLIMFTFSLEGNTL